MTRSTVEYTFADQMGYKLLYVQGASVRGAGKVACRKSHIYSQVYYDPTPHLVFLLYTGDSDNCFHVIEWAIKPHLLYPGPMYGIIISTADILVLLPLQMTAIIIIVISNWTWIIIAIADYYQRSTPVPSYNVVNHHHRWTKEAHSDSLWRSPIN